MAAGAVVAGETPVDGSALAVDDGVGACRVPVVTAAGGPRARPVLLNPLEGAVRRSLWQQGGHQTTTGLDVTAGPHGAACGGSAATAPMKPCRGTVIGLWLTALHDEEQRGERLSLRRVDQRLIGLADN